MSSARRVDKGREAVAAASDSTARSCGLSRGVVRNSPTFPLLPPAGFWFRLLLEPEDVLRAKKVKLSL
jgi:hypothetical protein